MPVEQEVKVPKQTIKDFLSKALTSNMVIDPEFIKFCLENNPDETRKYNGYRLYNLWLMHGDNRKIWELAEDDRR